MGTVPRRQDAQQCYNSFSSRRMLGMPIWMGYSFLQTGQMRAPCVTLICSQARYTRQEARGGEEKQGQVRREQRQVANRNRMSPTKGNTCAEEKGSGMSA